MCNFRLRPDDCDDEQVQTPPRPPAVNNNVNEQLDPPILPLCCARVLRVDDTFVPTEDRRMRRSDTHGDWVCCSCGTCYRPTSYPNVTHTCPLHQVAFVVDIGSGTAEISCIETENAEFAPVTCDFLVEIPARETIVDTPREANADSVQSARGSADPQVLIEVSDEEILPEAVAADNARDIDELMGVFRSIVWADELAVFSAILESNEDALS